MIKQFKDYNETQAAGVNGKFPQLPAGGYEAQVKKVQIAKNYDGSERLELLVDIIEGEYEGYFKKQYDNNKFEDKKYKGRVSFAIPTDDGSEKDGYKKRYFKAMAEAFEKSNAGYTWNWEEKSLLGLKVGIYVRDKEWDKDGKHGFAPEIYALEDINVIRSGEFETPKPKYLNGNAPATNKSDFTQTPQSSTANPFPTAEDDTYPF